LAKPISNAPIAAKAVIIQKKYANKETATAVNPEHKPTPSPSRLTAKLDSFYVQSQLTLGLFLFSVGIRHLRAALLPEALTAMERAK